MEAQTIYALCMTKQGFMIVLSYNDYSRSKDLGLEYQTSGTEFDILQFDADEINKVNDDQYSEELEIEARRFKLDKLVTKAFELKKRKELKDKLKSL